MNHCLHLDSSLPEASPLSQWEKRFRMGTLLWIICEGSVRLCIFRPAGVQVVNCTGLTQLRARQGPGDEGGKCSHLYLALGSRESRDRDPLGDVRSPCHEAMSRGRGQWQCVTSVWSPGVYDIMHCTPGLYTLNTHNHRPKCRHPTWTLFICKVSTWPSVEQAKTSALYIFAFTNYWQ